MLRFACYGVEANRIYHPRQTNVYLGEYCANKEVQGCLFKKKMVSVLI